MSGIFQFFFDITELIVFIFAVKTPYIRYIPYTYSFAIIILKVSTKWNPSSSFTVPIWIISPLNIIGSFIIIFISKCRFHSKSKIIQFALAISFAVILQPLYHGLVGVKMNSEPVYNQIRFCLIQCNTRYLAPRRGNPLVIYNPQNRHSQCFRFIWIWTVSIGKYHNTRRQLLRAVFTKVFEYHSKVCANVNWLALMFHL